MRRFGSIGFFAGSIGACMMIATLVQTGANGGEFLFAARQPRCNKNCVPGHNYTHDTPRFGATDFAVANAAVGSAVNHHKPFHFRATKLEIDHIRLDQIGLAIYKFPSSTKSSLGKIVGMGRIAHNGGDGGMKGSNVTIRIRAYVAPEADPNQIPPDAFVVWESRQNLWVSRGKPQLVQLVAENSSQSEKLNMHFAEITHLEVELEYQLDR